MAGEVIFAVTMKQGSCYDAKFLFHNMEGVNPTPVMCCSDRFGTKEFLKTNCNMECLRVMFLIHVIFLYCSVYIYILRPDSTD
jgi:hypothetical protein